VIEQLNFLTRESVLAIREQFGTPVYVYDESRLRAQAAEALAFPSPFGLTVRYAIKANPNAAFLRILDQLGLHFDASSGFEARRAMKAGVAADKISLSAQEMPDDFLALAEAGIRFVATSSRQLETWGRSLPGTSLAVRFNPGVGSGGTNRTNVGGPHASFGVWHEQLGDIKKIAEQHQLTIDRVHTHIGSGTDPEVWSRVAKLSLALVEQFESVTQIDLGGGYKVARMADEVATDLQSIGAPVHAAIREFAERTGRELHLEIEPGTFMVANVGSLVTEVHDVVSTGTEGHEFIRTDAGLTDILRPAMYGAQHPIVVVPVMPTEEVADYVVVGHCCETGDIMTPAPGDPEAVADRRTTKATPGDVLVIEGAGAYCSSMAASNYNSFPIVPEVLIRNDGTFEQIRRRQTLDEVIWLETND
jgi:diaminopimelate decarboxylase